MTYFNINDITKLNHLFKINLINSCTGYKSANLIATKSNNNITNVAVFSSVIHLGSAPPLLGFILRPTTVPRNTYENIKDTGYYTINHIHQEILKDAHHTSAKYKSEVSEFDVTKLEIDYKNNFFAPYVKNCPIQIGMKYIEEYNIKSNNTKLVVGEIQELYIEEKLISEDGFVNLSEGNVAAINGLDGYAIPTLKERFEYQRPIK
jgi:flavin reductase (DIM6/NTAB) family NADH-FMN oxidoreductase RutF